MLDFFKDKNDKNHVTISPSIVIFGTSFLLGLYFLFLIQSILIQLFLAFIISVALNPAVNRLQTKLRLPRVLCIALVYLLVITILVALIGFLLPPIAQDMYQLIRTFDIPVFQDQVKDIKFTLTEISALVDRVGSSVGLVFSIVTSTFSSIFTFLTLIVMSFYLMIDRPFLHRKVMWFTKDQKYVDIAKDFLDAIELQLGGWVRGQVILMTLIGLLTYIGLFFIGLPYALPLAVLAGFLEILPNLGPTIAAVPAVMLAYVSFGPVGAGIVTLFYVLIQQLENNIIVPKVLKDNVDVNPLVAMVTILIGLQLGGVIGALLSVPFYIVIRTAYSMWYKHKHQ